MFKHGVTRPLTKFFMPWDSFTSNKDETETITSLLTGPILIQVYIPIIRVLWHAINNLIFNFLDPDSYWSYSFQNWPTFGTVLDPYV